jgi:hypothetical protein
MLYTEISPLTAELKVVVTHKDTRQKTRFAKYLKAIADAEN